MSSIRSAFAASRRLGVPDGIASSIGSQAAQSRWRGGLWPRVRVILTAASMFLVVRLNSSRIDPFYGWPQVSYLAAIAATAIAASVFFFMRRRRRGPPGSNSHSVEHRQEFADALPHVLWGTGADGRCEFLNERYTEIFGIPRSEAIRDQSWVDPIHPADRPKMYQAWRGAVENGSSNYSAHARVRMNDGSYRWMESLGRSVRSPESGEVVRWFGSLVDVQSQVEDRETISRLQFDLQTVADECEKTVACCDERLRALFEPRELAWVEYDIKFAQPMSDMLRTHAVFDVSGRLALIPALSDEIRDAIRIRRASELGSKTLGYNGTIDTLSEWARTDSYRRLDVELAVLAALINGLSSACGIAELVDAEGEVSAYPFSLWITDGGVARVSLFDTRGSEERTEKAGSARQQLAKANRIACASALSTSLVHEMSQPITAISLDLATASRLVTMGPGGMEAVAKVMDRLRWNAQRLTEIGTRTRDSLKPNRLNRRPVDIAELAARSRDFVLAPLDLKNATIAITADDDLPLIEADPVALQQVLCALLLNALEAGDAVGTAAAVSVAISLPPLAAELHISVSDRGSGIQEEHLPLAFDPFFSTRPNRLGFGLTVCQCVVEGFGGTLTLNNRNGGGAVASFSIPLVDAAGSSVSSSI